MEQLGIFRPIMQQVDIKQKIVKDSPGEKLLDAWVTILAGSKGLVKANEHVRSDPALQRAFGRRRCAEQSVISETLNACTEENVRQMEAAMQTYAHNFEQDWQMLDEDLSGQPCGPKAEFATRA